jgi:hypothetical protein
MDVDMCSIALPSNPSSVMKQDAIPCKSKADVTQENSTGENLKHNQKQPSEVGPVAAQVVICACPDGRCFVAGEHEA